MRPVAVFLVGVLALATSDPGGARAAGDGSRQKTRVTPAMSEPVYRALREAQALAAKADHAGALKVIEKVRGRGRLSPYERAQAWNLTGYIHYLEERYPEAIRAYRQVIDQGEVPKGLLASVLRMLSHLHLATGEYAQVIATARRLTGLVDEPAADVHVLLGEAHFRLREYRAARKAVETALAVVRGRGGRPQESWLVLLQAIHFELGDYPEMIEVLKELLRLYPKEQYLRTLAGAYSQIGDTRKQLAVLEALQEDGRIGRGGEVVNLANLYLLHETPFKAARVLEKALESGLVEPNERNLRLLSQAWSQSRENAKALAPLARAASMSGTGELSLRLAQAYIELERWDEATRALEAGLSKGGLGRSDQAYVMLGMARFNMNQLSTAREAFGKALADKRSRGVADQWISYIDAEVERAEALAELAR